MSIFLILVIFINGCAEEAKSQNLCNDRTRFQCRDGICLSKAKVCNGFSECPGGEDEENCPTQILCPIRNMTLVRNNKYTCKRKCKRNRTCRGRRRACICDDECGSSCVSPNSRCRKPPPPVPHSSGYRILRKTPGTSQLQEIATNRHYFMDIAKYVCEKGRILTGPLPRCNARKRWSRETPTCVKITLEKIVGGHDAEENAWPWQVLITRKSNSMSESLQNGNIVGGGSILNENWILTAAHVLYWKNSAKYILFVGISRRFNNRGVVGRSIQAYSISRYENHPQFHSEKLFNDIALIKIGDKLDENLVAVDRVNEGIEFGRHIHSVRLPCAGQSLNDESRCSEEVTRLYAVDSNVVVTGFGHRDILYGKIRVLNPSRKLQQVELQIAPQTDCQQELDRINENLDRPNYNQFTPSMMCCKPHASTRSGACKGDSGGPLVKKVHSDNGTIWVQIGVVSFGLGCGTGYPEFYTNVTRFLIWMNSTMNGISPESLGCNFTHSSSPFCGYESRNWKRVLITDAQGLRGYSARSGYGDSYMKSVTVPTEWLEEEICLSFIYQVPEERTLTVKSTDYNPKIYLTIHENETSSTWLTAALTIHSNRSSCFQFHADGSGVLLDDVTFNVGACESLCEEAPAVTGATVSYTGFRSRRVARYTCQEGFYRRSGSPSLHCSAAGIWIGDPPVCEAVRCGDPGPSIRATRGYIYSYGGLHFGATIEFGCRSTYRLLGSRLRTCLGDGKWSGQLAVCDREDDLSRCAHPGVPINGWMDLLEGDDFSINSTVRFGCDRSYVLVGHEVQTCLWFKQWSGRFTPLCIDPKYPTMVTEVMSTLSRPSESLRRKEVSLGRSVMSHETDKEHEIYFMFDVSLSVLKKPRDLNEEIDLAKRLVERMSEFKGVIRYGIMLFASKAITPLDILKKPHPTPEEVIAKLDEIRTKIGENAYQEDTKSGTATASALRSLQKELSHMRDGRVEMNNGTKTVKTHVFVFTDGKHTVGGDPVEQRKLIEAEFHPNIEFYCITACESCDIDDFEELHGLASSNKEGNKNYIFIKDFYQLSKYLDSVTDVKVDFGKCGQAGDVESIKKQAALGRMGAGGEIAAENAWPWQAVISRKPDTGNLVFTKQFFLGGGSVLSQKWILTSAHVFDVGDSSKVVPQNFIVAAGLFRLPSAGNIIPSSVQMFHPESIILHSDYNHANYVNDIALIRVGQRLDPTTLSPDPSQDPILTYTYYVRPVCLPCTGTCVKRHQLTRRNGPSLIDEEMTEDEKCLVEENWLMERSSKVVVTGFGHSKEEAKSDYDVRLKDNLQQGLLKIEEKQRCRSGIQTINARMELEGNTSHVVSDSMFCCEPGSTGVCAGDGGGPVVREVTGGSHNSCWIQIGVVSFGYGCQFDDIPGYFTNVARFIPWLREMAGNETVPNHQ